MSFIQHTQRSIVRFFSTTPKRYTVSGAILVVALIATGLHVLNRTPATPAVTAQVSHVTLASVASLSSDTSALPVVGTVTSLHQATILAQSAGAVTAVNASLGSSVAAGTIIATLESASQNAAVVQAQGSYDAALASYEKATGTTAQNSTANAAQASASAQSAQASAIAALQTTYAALDDAVHTKGDTLFNNPRGSNPTLIGLTSPDSQIVQTVQNERLGIESVLTDAKARAGDTTPADIDANISAMIADTQVVATFAGNMVQLINQAVPNQIVTSSAIAGYQASIGAARTEVVASINGLTSAKNAYDNASTTAATMTNSASSGTASDIAIAKANVETALGALDAAQANLEKTIIRSPLSGTIVDLPIKQGDYVTAFSEAAIVSNASALEIVTQVTATDSKTLSIGGTATIGSDASGVITSIAPALNPTTNEIEVHIGITKGASTLTDGESVNLELVRTHTVDAINVGTKSSKAITIPIVALKITPSGPVVFTVSTSSTLVAHPISLGSILGDQVVVIDGLTPEMTIVQDARGHVAGDAVVVDAQ
ncbi:MAG TPA: HlyD family efflux transporter periplasmic adaptor subunit [Candidatus Paceibacterota bacterium]|nr:HlyD family efflux transporter periplasmic adaptor subunit [Candidatus Paceibacterota bacterium]